MEGMSNIIALPISPVRDSKSLLISSLIQGTTRMIPLKH